MIIKEKSWIWKLTYIARNNYTTIGNTIYYPKGFPPAASTIAHEEVHVMQRIQNGSFKFYFLYLFFLPILWNPWRFKWEMEAYQKNQSQETAKKLLRSAMYGWLLCH